MIEVHGVKPYAGPITYSTVYLDSPQMTLFPENRSDLPPVYPPFYNHSKEDQQ